MNVFTKFLASQVSGYLLLVVVAGVLAGGGVVWHWVSDYKDLQRDAAYCNGQLSAQKVLKSIQNRASDNVKAAAKVTVEEIEDLRDQAVEQAKDETDPTMGCAGQRAPDAILRYHGWVRD